MPETQILIPFLAALIAVYLVPGPDMALVISSAATRGLKAGCRTALGIGAARFCHVLGAGLGLAALFTRYPLLQELVRLAGAGYLFYLALGFLRAATNAGETTAPLTGSNGDYRCGFLTNLLNPKALLFCSLLLPQFTSSGPTPLLIQFIFLGVILVIVGFLFDSAYALFASGVARNLTGRFSPGPPSSVKFHPVRNRLLALVFIGISVRIVTG